MYTPVFEITPYLLKTITACTQLQSWILDSNIRLDWRPQLEQKTAARIAHFSTSIEGNMLSLDEVETLANGIKLGSSKQAEIEIQNYLAALRWIWNQPRHSRLTEEKLLHIHSLITANLLPAQKVGQYKTTTNKIIDHQEIVVYTAPPPQKSIQLTRELINWINAEETQILHPIIINAIVHHQLVSIHPFSDGNGRTARALAMWILHNLGFDSLHLLPLDEAFATNREKYYCMLQQARDLDSVLTYWIDYVATCMHTTLLDCKKRIQSLKVSAQTSQHFSKQQERLLRYIGEKGRVRSPEIEGDFNISRARISQLLQPLVASGLVIREGFTRATTYRLGDL